VICIIRRNSYAIYMNLLLIMWTCVRINLTSLQHKREASAVVEQILWMRNRQPCLKVATTKITTTNDSHLPRPLLALSCFHCCESIPLLAFSASTSRCTSLPLANKRYPVLAAKWIRQATVSPIQAFAPVQPFKMWRDQKKLG
jgi:hypothetical protein